MAVRRPRICGCRHISRQLASRTVLAVWLHDLRVSAWYFDKEFSHRRFALAPGTFGSVSFLHPGPLPWGAWGEGESSAVFRPYRRRTLPSQWALNRLGAGSSLSPRERVRVRGNDSSTATGCCFSKGLLSMPLPDHPQHAANVRMEITLPT